MRNDENPSRAGTRRGAELLKDSRAILQHHRRDCANCGTPLHPREFRTCRPCRGYLALWRALVEMSQIGGSVL